MAVAVPFPDVQPAGYEWLDAEPAFDAGRHLELEPPSETRSLVDLGYQQQDIASKATPFAVSAPFRVLSDEGAAVLLDSCRRLQPFHHRAGDRIERVVRGGCYRSRFLRDLCISPEVTQHLSTIYGVEVALIQWRYILGTSTTRLQRWATRSTNGTTTPCRSTS